MDSLSGSQSWAVTSTGTGIFALPAEEAWPRYLSAARISRIAALLFPEPGAPVMISRPDPSPPYMACRSLTWPHDSCAAPADSRPGSVSNRRDLIAAAFGTAIASDGLAQVT